MSERLLEETLAEVEAERDALKATVAKLQSEAQIYRNCIADAFSVLHARRAYDDAITELQKTVLAVVEMQSGKSIT